MIFRKVISLIVIGFLTGCASIQAAPSEAQKALYNKYMNTKTAIIIKCGGEADHIKEIADYRDQGNSQNDVVNTIIQLYADETTYSTISPPLVIEEVIEELILITMIFDRVDSTPAELFKSRYDYCVNGHMALLEEAYTYDKEDLKNEKNKPKTNSSH